jgi:hypothetical protein
LNPLSFSRRKMGRKIVEWHIQMEELLVRLGNFCFKPYLYKTSTGTGNNEGVAKIKTIPVMVY